MCIATAAAIAAVAAGAIGAAGSIRAGNDQASALKYNASVEEQNAQASREQAAAQSAQQEQINKRKLGDAASAFGASGVDPNRGSALDVMADLATQGELSKRLITYQGELNARGLQQQAGLDRISASNAKTAGYINAATTLLSAGAKAGGSLYTPKAPPKPPSVSSSDY